MFDIGGPELVIIAIIAIIVIGPKELPGAIKTVTAVIRKARGLAAEFRAGLDDMVREAEIDEVKRQLRDDLDPAGLGNSIEAEIKDAVDPDDEFADSFEFDGDWYGPDEGIEDDQPAEEPTPRAGAAPDLASAAEADPGEEAAPTPRADAAS